MEEEKSLQDLIVPVLEKEFSGLVQRPVKTRAIERKSVSVDPGYVDLNKVPPVAEKPSGGQIGVPVDPSEVPMRKCHQCSQPFTLDRLTDLPIAGGKVKPFCDGCIEDIKNGQA